MKSERERLSGSAPLTRERVIAMALETMLTQGRHKPILIVEGSRHYGMVAFEDFGSTHEERADQMYLAGIELARAGNVGVPAQVFFISEAWLSLARDGKAPLNPPSADPQRKEALIISHADIPAQQMSLAAFAMVRDGAGELRELLPFEDFGDEPGHAASPLLAAFIQGFALGLDGK